MYIMKFSILGIVFLASCASINDSIVTQEDYLLAIKTKIEKNLYAPKESYPFYDCEVLIRQDKRGKVLAIEPQKCETEQFLIKEFETAITKASPLPLPDNLALFDPDLRLRFCRNCESRIGQ